MDAVKIESRFAELKRQGAYASARRLAEDMAINRHSINKILRGDINTERDRILFRAVLDKIGFDEESFFSRGKPRARQIAAELDTTRKIPLYGEIPAGNPTGVDGAAVAEAYIDPPPNAPVKEMYALRVNGMSMYSRLIPGDIVYLQPLDIRMGVKIPARPIPKLTFEKLDRRIVAVLINKESTLKLLRIKALPGKDNYELKLKPFNREFQTITIQPDDEVVFQGVVFNSLRDESNVAFNSLQPDDDE